MIELLGGAGLMLIIYGAAFVVPLGLVAIISDFIIEFVTQGDYKGGFYQAWDNFMDDPNSQGWVISIMICFFAVLAMLIIGGAETHGGSQVNKWGHDFMAFVTFPYWLGAKLSWIFAPIAVVTGLMFAARAMYSTAKAAKKFKAALDQHIADKGAHGLRTRSETVKDTIGTEMYVGRKEL